jgi:hypothetical protein
MAERLGASPAKRELRMLQNLAAEIIHCYKRARQARKVEDGHSPKFLDILSAR